MKREITGACEVTIKGLRVKQPPGQYFTGYIISTAK